MSRGDWLKHSKIRLIAGLVSAVAFSLLILGYGLLQSSKYEWQADSHTREYSGYTSKKVAESCVGVPQVERIKCLYDAMDAEAEYKYNQADLVAQRQSALWAYIMALAAIIGMLLSAVGVFLVWTTFRETRRTADQALEANRIAQDGQQRQLRAYLTFKSVVVSFDENDWKLQIEWINAGQTPAYHVHTYADWIELESPIPDDFGFLPQPPRLGEGVATIGMGISVFGTCETDFPKALLSAIASGVRYGYIWGAVDYMDAFGVPRRTEAALWMRVENLTGDGNIVIRWTSVGRHNNMDGDCLHKPKHQPEIE